MEDDEESFSPYAPYKPLVRKLVGGTLLTMQIGLLVSELAVPAVVVWRLTSSTGNHVGFDPLWVSVALAALLAIVSAIRIAVLHRWGNMFIAATVATVLSLSLVGYVNSCHFLVGYESWLQRRMPAPNPSCCFVLRFSRACQLPRHEDKP